MLCLYLEQITNVDLTPNGSSTLTSVPFSLSSLMKTSIKPQQSAAGQQQPQQPQTQRQAPMSNVDKLVQMGFSNRALNRQLLRKNNNDFCKTVHELLDNTDNDWFENR